MWLVVAGTHFFFATIPFIFYFYFVPEHTTQRMNKSRSRRLRAANQLSCRGSAKKKKLMNKNHSRWQEQLAEVEGSHSASFCFVKTKNCFVLKLRCLRRLSAGTRICYRGSEFFLVCKNIANNRNTLTRTHAHTHTTHTLSHTHTHNTCFA